MGFIRGWEWLIILVIVIIIFGVGKLPQVGGALGKSIREFRKSKEEGDAEAKAAATAQSSQQVSEPPPARDENKKS